MRHLFVPACVCLMSWSGATGFDSGLSLEEFYGNRELAADPVTVKNPADVTAIDIALEFPTEPQTEFPKGIPLPPVAKPVVHRSVEEVCEALTQEAKKNDLPVPFFIHLLFQESRFDPASVSSAGAQGIAQFMPETAADMGLKNPFDPLQAIPASARLLRNLVAQFGNLGLAAAAYNAGPRRVQDWLGKLAEKKPDKDKKGDKKVATKSALPDETQGYVKIITGRPIENWTLASAALPGQKLPRHAPCQEAAGLYAFAGPDTIPLPTASPLTHQASAEVAKPGSQQLAARKRKIATHKIDLQTSQQVAQR